MESMIAAVVEQWQRNREVKGKEVEVECMKYEYNRGQFLRSRCTYRTLFIRWYLLLVY